MNQEGVRNGVHGPAAAAAARRAGPRPLWLGWLLAAALVGGCDPQRVAKLEEGVSTETQVREQFGEPVTVTIDADGTRTLEYPRQPAGWTNYVIQIGPDGKMSSLRQLLSDDNMARVQPGMTQQQVRDLLGRPAAQHRFDLKQQDVWDWRYKPDGQDSKLFSVTFDDKRQVVAKAVADDPREVAQ